MEGYTPLTSPISAKIRIWPTAPPLSEKLYLRHPQTNQTKDNFQEENMHIRKKLYICDVKKTKEIR